MKRALLISAVCFLTAACAAQTDDSCTIVDGDRIVCDDGTRVDLPAGSNGDDGNPGTVGEQGAPGVDGASCSVEDTDDGSVVRCDDGTVAAILDGSDGADGTNGADGIDGSRGPAGEDGTDGANGEPGTGASSSGDRLEVVTLAGSDGSTYSSNVYWDTGLDAFCEPKRHADGALRCIPIYQATVSELYFSGMSCDTPYAEDTYRGAARPKYAVQTVPSEGLDPTEPFQDAYRVFFATDRVEGSFYWGPSDCTESVSFPDAEIYVVGAEIEASVFIEFVTT